MKNKLLLILLLLSFRSFSQDIRGAYISTAWVPTFTYTYSYSVTVTLIVDPTLGIPHPTVFVTFGDNSSATFSVTSVSNQNGLEIRKYQDVHTYAGGTLNDNTFYLLKVINNFRVADIVNIPDSENQSIVAMTRLYASNTTWTNTSVAIANPNPTFTLSGNRVLFDPIFSDVSGDSLDFSLENCYADVYRLPVGATINPLTGVVSFSKDSTGIFAFYIKAVEWKKNTNGFFKTAGITYFDYSVDIPQVLGLQENPLANGWAFYPNPVKDKITIKLSKIDARSLSVYNVLGKEIRQFRISGLETEIDFGDLPEGVYFIRVNASTGYQTKKFIKE